MQTLLKTTKAYNLLKAEGKEGRFAHAYLLLLNDSKNLKEALKTFAKLFFDCEQSELFKDCPQTAEMQKKRRISELIDSENFSDCLFFPSDGKKLTVEDAEKIREESTLNPVEGDKKVFLLGDFAEANTQTQNKLLKLLEEPPKGVIFLLGATTVFPVLSTVLSRTKKLEILPFNNEEIADCLCRIYKDKYDKNTYALCAATSGGSLGEAQNILEGGYYQELLENALSLVKCSPAKLPLIVKNISETKHPKELLNLLRLIYRDLLLIKTNTDNKGAKLLLKSEYSCLQELAKNYTLPALFYAQEAISEAEKQVKFNAVFSQCIELCLANIQAKNKGI